MNPIAAIERLGVIMHPMANEASEAWGVLNPAVVRGRDGELYLFARVVAEGNYSRIRMARVLFDASGKPAGLERLGFVLEPYAPYECREDGGGCEDPRIVFIPMLDRYVMTYTGFGPKGARVAVAISSDLFTWERLGVVDFAEQEGIDFNAFDNKDAFFFPEPVIAPDGTVSLACMHRPMTGAEQYWSQTSQLTDLLPSIWVSYVPVAEVLNDIRHLLCLRQHRIVAQPTYSWEHLKIGGGTPPVLTACGWLLFYHGIENFASEGEPRRLRYSAGAFIVDRWDVTRVIWRSTEPILVPETEDERIGIVNNVVFPTGIDKISDDVVDVYYGMADARIGIIRVWLRREACSEGTIEAA
jgi:predicted GH43/DUF377 family glycosyl hydrolase